MNDSITEGSSRVKLIAALTVFVMAFAALAFCPADTSDADDAIEVSTWDELQHAIKSASGETYITLTEDIKDDSGDDPATIERNVRIYLDLANHTIDRQNGRLFELDEGHLDVTNGTLKGGHADKGGCIYSDGGQIKLENVTVTGSYAKEKGGAVYVESAIVWIMDTQFNNNVCDGDGGALYLSGCDLSIRATFEKNSCGKNGGAMYFKGGEDRGGAMSECTFKENSAGENGGAVALIEGGMSVMACTFDGNYVQDSGADGGAIYADDSKMVISDNNGSQSVFKNNKAPKAGGALRLDGDEYQLKETVIEYNTAKGHGGGIYINGESEVSLETVRIKNNHADLDGGGMLIGGDDNEVSVLYGIEISGNTADRNGANLYIRSDIKLKCSLNLDFKSKVGVDLEQQGRVFTDGLDDDDIDPTKVFFSDNPNYYVGSEGGEAKMFKSGTSGDMSDNTIWIVVGIIVAVLVVAAVVYVVKTRKP
jgi:predicted outer membrane repeat protein